MAAVVPLRQPSKMGKWVKTLPRRLKNPERRRREYLTATEVEALMEGARQVGRHGVTGT